MVSSMASGTSRCRQTTRRLDRTTRPQLGCWVLHRLVGSGGLDDPLDRPAGDVNVDAGRFPGKGDGNGHRVIAASSRRTFPLDQRDRPSKG